MAKTKDIFEPSAKKQKVKPDMVIFEINDAGRESEYDRRGRGGYNYVSPFISFLESLGLEMETEKHSQEIVIKGVSFHIDPTSATYKSFLQYGNIVQVRKPENRFVLLKRSSINENYVVKVHINKEIDANKIRKKIDDAIAAHHKDIKEREEYIKLQDKLAVEFCTHYLSDKFIRSSVSGVKLEGGRIIFNLKSNESITITTDHQIHSLYFGVPHEMKDLKKIKAFVDQLDKRGKNFYKVVSAILKHPKAPSNLIEWAMEGRSGRHTSWFNSDKMKLEKH